MVHHTMKPEVGPVCRGLMYSGRWRSTDLRSTRVRPSLAYRDNLLSSLKTIDSHSTLQMTLSRHQSSRPWRCRGLSGSLARGTRDLSPAVNRRFSMVLGHTADALSVRISSLDAVLAAISASRIRFWRASLLRGRENLVYGCGNISQTTAESSDTPPIHCAQHVNQAVDMPI